MKLQQNLTVIIITTIVIVIIIHDHDSIGRTHCYKIDPNSRHQLLEKPYVLIEFQDNIFLLRRMKNMYFCLCLWTDYSLLDHNRLLCAFLWAFFSVRGIHGATSFYCWWKPVVLNPVIHLQDWILLLSPVSDSIASGSCTNWVFAAPEQGCSNFHYGYL